MYQVVQFVVDRKAKPAPVIWIFRDKGRWKCYWPKRDVETKLKKRTPPPMTVQNSKSWDIFEVKLHLNGKMFDSLDSARANSEKIESALRESNCSLNSESCSKANCSRSTDSSIRSESSSSEKLLLSEKKEIINKVKIIEIKTVEAFKDYELYLNNEINMECFANFWLEWDETDEVKFIQGMIFRTFEKEFFFNNVSIKGDKNKLSLADSNIIRCWIYVLGKKFGEKIIFDKIVSSIPNVEESAQSSNDCRHVQSLEKSVDIYSRVVDVHKDFPIRDPERFKRSEILLLEKSNIEIVSDNWIRICQNKVNLFVQAMIAKTFINDFTLNHTTFKVGDKDRELLEGSNIFKCWEVTVAKKFPEKSISEDDIKKHFKTYKNTIGKSAIPKN